MGVFQHFLLLRSLLALGLVVVKRKGAGYCLLRVSAGSMEESITIPG